MFLIILLILVTVAISGTAAFFSVYGLAHIFTSAFIPSLIMGASLEAGKLVITSFLYRFWKNIGIGFKSTIILLVAGLMLFTSIGIFGYLTASYQSGSINLNDNKQRIEFLSQEKESYENRLLDINSQIQNVPPEYVSKRIELIKTLNVEKDDILTKLQAISDERSKLLSEKIQSEAKVGPIIYIAEAIGKPVDNSVVYLVLFIMLIFDPLAITMTVATNVAIVSRKNEKEKLEPPVELVTPDSMDDGVEEPVQQVDHTETLSQILSRLDNLSGSMDKSAKRAELAKASREI